MQHHDDKPEESISGTVEKLVYKNPDNGYFVARVNIPGRKDILTLTGISSKLHEGESINAIGRWIMDKKYGLQFHAAKVETFIPKNLTGIQKYLSSGIIDGIGKSYAKRLIDAFGDKVFDIIENQPNLLSMVDGIGNKKIKLIVESWKSQKVLKNIMIFLHEHNISTGRGIKIYKQYGDNAIEVIKENPYRLARDIHGIGFSIADNIAISLGIKPDSALRVRGGIRHVLLEAAEDGSCGMLIKSLIEKSTSLLEVGQEIVVDAIKAEIVEGEILALSFEDKDAVFLKKFALAEEKIASILHRISSAKPKWSRPLTQEGIEDLEKELNIKFSQGQIDAVKLALKSNLLVITGGPGSGKTTIVRAILAALSKSRITITLAAPTGRAARRLSSATGYNASTIHRLLGRNLYAISKQDNPSITSDLLVVDEASMIDVPLMLSLLSEMSTTCGLLIIGDTDQLPSIGPGRVLADMIDSEKLPVVALKEVFRQSRNSSIISNCYMVNEGKMPMLDNSSSSGDFYFIASVNDPERDREIIINLVKDRIPKSFGFNLEDIQVLSPMARGALGTHMLNEAMQSRINTYQGKVLERQGRKFIPGDKVMQTTNNYDKDVFNGDTGFIDSINFEENFLLVNFENERAVEYEFSELDELVLAYAMTIHKSQGSEYKAVIIPLMRSHYPMLQRNLLYTALSRGKQLVVIVGDKSSVSRAVSTISSQKRCSLLKTRIQEQAKGNVNSLE